MRFVLLLLVGFVLAGCVSTQPKVSAVSEGPRSVASSAPLEVLCEKPVTLDFSSGGLVPKPDMAYKIFQSGAEEKIQMIASGQTFPVDRRSYKPTKDVLDFIKTLKVKVEPKDVVEVVDHSPNRAQCSDGICFRSQALLDSKQKILGVLFSMGHLVGKCEMGPRNPASTRDPARSSRQLGKECGLSNNWSQFSANRAQQIYDFTESAQAVKKVSPMLKRQLIACANTNGENKVFSEAVAATDYLRENSEAQELYVFRVPFRGKVFSAIQYAGGGNTTGCLFPENEATLLAEIGDGEIFCRP